MSVNDLRALAERRGPNKFATVPKVALMCGLQKPMRSCLNARQPESGRRVASSKVLGHSRDVNVSLLTNPMASNSYFDTKHASQQDFHRESSFHPVRVEQIIGRKR